MIFCVIRDQSADQLEDVTQIPANFLSRVDWLVIYVPYFYMELIKYILRFSLLKHYGYA